MDRVSEPHDSLSLGVTKFQFLQCDLYVLLVSVKHKYQMCGTKITKIYGPLSLNLGPYQGQIQWTRSHIFPMVYQQMPYSSSHFHIHPYTFTCSWLVLIIAKASFLSKITNSEFRVAFSGEDIEVWDQSPQERGWKIRLFRGDILIILITLPCYIRNKMLEFVACVMCVVAHADIQNKQLYRKSPMNMRDRMYMYMSSVVGGFSMF